MGIRSAFFARNYDRFMRKAERDGLHARRTALVAPARGRVLEIGAGTGANLDLYGTDLVELTVTEPEPGMLRRLERRLATSGTDATAVSAPAERLPFEDDRFDVVVSTLVLCGVTDQAAALAEIRRVLRPGGELRFLEHVRGDDAKLARHQDRMNWLNRLVVCCDCNRATVPAIEAAGFTIAELAHGDKPNSPGFVRPLVVGVAIAPAAARAPESVAMLHSHDPAPG
ncbi:MAG: class I SAM-dependent methyltransferase [Actinomycetota bacterium]